MKAKTKALAAESFRNFRLPRYEEIPNVGLYLEQTTKYIAEYLNPIQEGALTASELGQRIFIDDGSVDNAHMHPPRCPYSG